MPSSEWPARAVRSGSPTSSRPALAVRMPQSSSHAMSACARRATSNTVVGCSLRLSRADRARGRESRARAQRQRDHVPARAIGQARHRGLRSEPCRFPAAHGRAAVDLRPSAVDVRPLQALESSASTLAETSSRSGAASTSLSPPDAQGELTNRQRPRLGIQPRGRVRPRHLQDSRLSHPIRQLLRPAPREQPIITTAEDGHRHGDVRDRVRQRILQVRPHEVHETADPWSRHSGRCVWLRSPARVDCRTASGCTDAATNAPRDPPSARQHEPDHSG
jgi:hypothetical protein